MKKFFLLSLVALLATSLFAVEGALPGQFAVSYGKVINFSQGNLQYQASTTTWRFATNQYDLIGEDNAAILGAFLVTKVTPSKRFSYLTITSNPQMISFSCFSFLRLVFCSESGKSNGGIRNSTLLSKLYNIPSSEE